MQHAVLSQPREKCGLCGIFGHPEAARLAYFGLFALQHRGQDGAGLISHDGFRTWRHEGIGLVAEIFTEKSIRFLPGTTALGHVAATVSGATATAAVQRRLPPAIGPHHIRSP
jgi:amidophosphoribosyltransferase